MFNFQPLIIGIGIGFGMDDLFLISACFQYASNTQKSYRLFIDYANKGLSAIEISILYDAL